MNPHVLIDALPEIVTQLIAFLIVYWVLKKFAFQSILKVVEERQRVIADSVREAELNSRETDRLKKEYESRIHEIESEAEARIQEAIKEGNKASREIKEKAREDALAISQRAKDDVAQEYLKAKAVLREEAVELSTQVAARLIQKNLSDEDNRKFAQKVLKEAEETR